MFQEASLNLLWQVSQEVQLHPAVKLETFILYICTEAT